MARRRQSCHASSARCAQNPRCDIACRQGAGRLSTKAGLEADCPIGHRPCGDRTCRPNTGCCTLHGRPRAIPPGHQEGICQSIVRVAAKPSEMIPRPTKRRKLSISCGSERRPATACRGCRHPLGAKAGYSSREYGYVFQSHRWRRARQRRAR